MNIYLNGESYCMVVDHMPVVMCDLLGTLPGLSQAFAVMQNEVFVPKSLYSLTVLGENDRIDIITPMQGG